MSMLLKGLLNHVLRNQADDGASGGGGGGGGASSGDGGQAGTQDGQQSANDGGAAQGNGDTAAAGGSVLAQAGGEADKGESQGETLAIPEKYQVKKEDGTVDDAASLQKFLQGHKALEQRLGAGVTLPKSAGEYQVTVPDELKEVFNPNEDSLFQEFRDRAFEKKIPQEAFDFMMGEYFKLAPQLVAGSNIVSAKECTEALQQEWKTPDEYKAGLKQAFRPLKAYGDSDAQYLMDTYGNDPKFIRFLHRIGAEIQEDASIGGDDGAGTQNESIESLLASAAYKDAKHPDHKAVSARVSAYYARKTKGTQLIG